MCSLKNKIGQKIFALNISEEVIFGIHNFYKVTWTFAATDDLFSRPIVEDLESILRKRFGQNSRIKIGKGRM
jgi:hypothetical protein